MARKIVMATEQQVKRALDEFADDLMSRANVVGVGIVHAARRDEGAAPAQTEPKIAAYVSKKLPLDQLNEKDVVPSVLNLPSRTDIVHVPVCVIEQGPVTLETDDVVSQETD